MSDDDAQAAEAAKKAEAEREAAAREAEKQELAALRKEKQEAAEKKKQEEAAAAKAEREELAALRKEKEEAAARSTTPPKTKAEKQAAAGSEGAGGEGTVKTKRRVSRWFPESDD